MAAPTHLSGAGCGDHGEGEEINVHYHHRQLAGEPSTVVVAFRLATEKSWSGGVSKRMPVASPLPAARRSSPAFSSSPFSSPSFFPFSMFSHLRLPLCLYAAPPLWRSPPRVCRRLYDSVRRRIRRRSSSPPVSPAACPTSWCAMGAIQIEHGHERRRAPLPAPLLCRRRLAHRRPAEWSTSGAAIPAVTCASLRRRSAARPRLCRAPPGHAAQVTGDHSLDRDKVF